MAVNVIWGGGKVEKTNLKLSERREGEKHTELVFYVIHKELLIEIRKFILASETSTRHIFQVHQI